jgi:hypothetical protein
VSTLLIVYYRIFLSIGSPPNITPTTLFTPSRFRQRFNTESVQKNTYASLFIQSEQRPRARRLRAACIKSARAYSETWIISAATSTSQVTAARGCARHLYGNLILPPFHGRGLRVHKMTNWFCDTHHTAPRYSSYHFFIQKYFSQQNR